MRLSERTVRLLKDYGDPEATSLHKMWGAYSAEINPRSDEVELGVTADPLEAARRGHLSDNGLASSG